MMKQEAKLAAAYTRLAGQGTVTVRKLKTEAGTSTDAAAQFLRDVATTADVPPTPDLSAALNIIWAQAWEQATTQAREEFTSRLDEALEAQAAAEADRDEAEQAMKTAQTQAEDQAKQLAAITQHAHQAETELKTCSEQLRETERLRTEDRERALRAEAGLDELRAVIHQLRPAPTTKATPTKTSATPRKTTTKTAK